ncbi:SDR family NAD(P)-dependent oxidoreductase [Catenulispora yoronensis]|uniref:SDR family NAD(P)-dependent oxidoreductase n=1 Tax=Catenulispora yoronensis TaxID=450799 RepID=A0ABP5FYH4_9ACTN
MIEQATDPHLAPESAPDGAPGPEPESHGPGLPPERLALLLDILAEVQELPTEHPDAIAVRRATAGVYKNVKVRRRAERQARVQAADRAVIAATATGAPNRLDDETQGLPLSSTTSDSGNIVAGVLLRERGCYVCKVRYREVHAFYHQLCPDCAAENWRRRDARTDLTGKRALLTGGRAKIGMYIALRLLRDGAHLTITTRFPRDAARRFAAMPDSADWLHRLKIVGIDLRDLAQVVALADAVAAEGPLDVVVNNAAQTVRRSPGAYEPLIRAEAEPLPAGPLPELVSFGRFTGSGLVALPGQSRSPEAIADDLVRLGARSGGAPATAAATPSELVSLALTAGSAAPDRIAAGTAIDAGGLVPDLADSNSWVQTVEDVDPIELLEVQLCNSTAPFVLISRLRAAMKASPAPRKHIVNVSAMEGVFSRGYKGPGHPHTNMAKAALNMLTRTAAKEMFETDGILMNSVDTGWITDERPHPDRVRLADEGFHAPLDLVDGAARVYDPIVRGEQGEDLYGCFLKDYANAGW